MVANSFGRLRCRAESHVANWRRKAVVRRPDGRPIPAAHECGALYARRVAQGRAGCPQVRPTRRTRRPRTQRGVPRMKRERWIRPLVSALHPYVPGEQPRIKGLIKLNTNENPYPPSPKVLQAVRAAVDGRLRLYPNPTAQLLRERLAKFHRCRPENIIIGNGSDELLAMAVRCFV